MENSQRDVGLAGLRLIAAAGRRYGRQGLRTSRGRRVMLPVADGRHHFHVLGATGSGKSTLLTNMVLDDIAAGRGVAVIDPKGDLITDLLDRIPLGKQPAGSCCSTPTKPRPAASTPSR